MSGLIVGESLLGSVMAAVIGFTGEGEPLGVGIYRRVTGGAVHAA